MRGTSWVTSLRLPPLIVVGQGQFGGVDEEMVFRAPVSAVNRARARLGAPFFA
jgi:hypothetical protein